MINFFANSIKFFGIFFLAALLSACGGGESANENTDSATSSTAIDTVSDTTSISGDDTDTTNVTDTTKTGNTGNTGNTTSNGAATLSWTAPTQNVDGSALTNLSGYKIYYGAQLGDYQNSVAINNPGITEYVIDNLQGNNTYYFVVTAFDSQGNESGLSNVANKVIN